MFSDLFKLKSGTLFEGSLYFLKSENRENIRFPSVCEELFHIACTDYVLMTFQSHQILFQTVSFGHVNETKGAVERY